MLSFVDISLLINLSEDSGLELVLLFLLGDAHVLGGDGAGLGTLGLLFSVGFVPVLHFSLLDSHRLKLISLLLLSESLLLKRQESLALLAELGSQLSLLIFVAKDLNSALLADYLQKRRQE